MSRLYAVESQYSITGGMADHRRRLRAADIPHLAAAVAQGLGVGAGSQGAAAFTADPFVQAIVEDVRAAGGRAVFVAGPTQPAQIHALCAALNGRYGAGAVSYLATGDAPPPPLAQALPALVSDMAAGRVQVLLMLGTNPAYDLPAELGFTAALARVPLSVHVGAYRDESAALATWHVPQAHYLESWGDGRAWDGTVSVIQPLIAPLFEDAHSDIEVLNLFATGQVRPGYELVRETLGARLGSEDAWRTALHDGFLPGTAYPAGAAGGAAPDLTQLPVLPPDALELTFRVSPKVHDGRFANNVWLQELPHNVTKLVWDNAAVVSPATAEALGLAMRLDKGKRFADRLTIRSGDVAVSLPVWIQPGHPDGSIGLELGYGRALGTDRQLRDRGLFARMFDRDFDIYFEGAPAATAGADGAAVGVTATSSASGPCRRSCPIRRTSSTSTSSTRRPGRPTRPSGPTTARRSTTPASRRRCTARTSGGWPSTSTRAPAATRASWRARARTTSPSWARTRSRGGARCTGSASTATTPRSTRRRTAPPTRTPPSPSR
jgi:molybdopterin-containing oxidoreductase family iron-sulfur binding subunit